MSSKVLRCATLAALIAAGCKTYGPAGRVATSGGRLFEGLGSHQRKVTTASPRAQEFFDQGLIWAYAFNHDEAIRSFTAATALDPGCAMAWWGIALCNGPHINNPVMPPERSKAAWDALQRALALRDSADPAERAMIDALAKRYADPAPEDRTGLDRAYADAMAQAWAAYPNDADIGTLYAEAMMDLRPWDLWNKDGTPQPGTETILAVLDEVLRLDPENPGANHLYIHAVEASPHPERANAAADRLRRSVPSSGHLTHMPSHIDVLTGRWAQASQQNEWAIESDRKYRRISPKQDFYRIYMAHNHHMLAFASMMEGRREAALRAARDVVAGVPEDYGRENAALIDGFMGAPYDVLKRFGRWDDLLAEPAPPDYWPITTAMWRYARGIARAAKGDMNAAERERIEFLSAAAKVPKDAVFAINPAARILEVAGHMLDGEIALAQGNYDLAEVALRKGVEIEDSLMYMEPPEWIQPVRHTLGVVLLKAGRYEEAEQVYREDLKKWPNNGWSLQGLAKCLRARGAAADAAETERAFREVWKRADTPIGSSCLCVPST
jgi:tetratricopeptide (TPR) repeat protein